MIKDFAAPAVEIECSTNAVRAGDRFVRPGTEDTPLVATSRNFCAGKVRGLPVRVVHRRVVEIRAQEIRATHIAFDKFTHVQRVVSKLAVVIDVRIQILGKG